MSGRDHEMTTHVLIAVNDFNEGHLERISLALAGEATWEHIDQFSTPSVFRPALSRSQVLVGWPDPAWLLDSPVRFHQLPSVGYDDYLGVGLADKVDFVLCNARGVMSDAVAEHFVALMMALTRRLPQHMRDMGRANWQRQPTYDEVAGKTTCIVGLGDIGTQIARRCLALGMNVIGVRRHPSKQHAMVETVFAIERVAEAVACADHVVLIMPAEPENIGFFGDALFRSMKPGAFFYNLARGSVVDENALIEHLQNGKLSGAGLDVFRQEPLPADSPLWRMENVIITPHAAGRSVREFDRLCELFVANLERYFQGEPLLNEVRLF